MVVPGSHLEAPPTRTTPIRRDLDRRGPRRAAQPTPRISTTAIALTGDAGMVSVHHGLTLHYSAPNHSASGRPVLVVTYRAADAIAYTAPPYRSSHYGALVRGVDPGVAHHEELTLHLPPDWTDGYTSIFSHQDLLTNTEPENPRWHHHLRKPNSTPASRRCEAR